MANRGKANGFEGARPMDLSVSNGLAHLLIKCFCGYPILEDSSAFIFYSKMKGLKGSRVRKSVFHVVSRQWRNIECHNHKRSLVPLKTLV